MHINRDRLRDCRTAFLALHSVGDNFTRRATLHALDFLNLRSVSVRWAQDGFRCRSQPHHDCIAGNMSAWRADFLFQHPPSSYGFRWVQQRGRPCIAHQRERERESKYAAVSQLAVQNASTRLSQFIGTLIGTNSYVFIASVIFKLTPTSFTAAQATASSIQRANERYRAAH